MPLSVSEPSIFAKIVDELRSKSEAELKLLYLKFFADDIKKEWKDATKESMFENTSEEDIVKVIQQKRYNK
jgi:RNA processing factor Prp31